jgi:hypothetical protein
VVQRARGDDGVERPGVGEALESHAAEDHPLRRLGVDRGHLVPGVVERAGQLAAATPDLKHAAAAVAEL